MLILVRAAAICLKTVREELFVGDGIQHFWLQVKREHEFRGLTGYIPFWTSGLVESER